MGQKAYWTLAIGHFVAMTIVTTLLGQFAWWLDETYGLWPFVPLFGLILWATCWMERVEQRRLGVRRPLFRWHND